MKSTFEYAFFTIANRVSLNIFNFTLNDHDPKQTSLSTACNSGEPQDFGRTTTDSEGVSTMFFRSSCMHCKTKTRAFVLTLLLG
ncbi:MAG: hypothetical protein P8L18_08770, partial [Verrucomicrobiota bacterium]|nr:hypothetical protein [Verrucomicrobiota bacterium]